MWCLEAGEAEYFREREKKKIKTLLSLQLANLKTLLRFLGVWLTCTLSRVSEFRSHSQH